MTSDCDQEMVTVVDPQPTGTHTSSISVESVATPSNTMDQSKGTVIQYMHGQQNATQQIHSLQHTNRCTYSINR